MENCVLFTESSPNVGGQELQLMQQMEGMSARGFQPFLACRAGTRVEQVARERGLRVLGLSFRNSLDVRTIFSLRNWMARNRPVLGICHSGHDTNNLAIASRLVAGRPFLLRSRTYQPGRARAFSYNHLVDATMLPSQYLRRCVLENAAIDARRLHVVHPGIDFAAVDRNARAPLPADLEEWLNQTRGPVLVHAAMLRGEKGHTLLLNVLHRMRHAWPEVRYVIAGEGGERESIAGEIKHLGLESRVFMAGLVRPIEALLARAQLVVMPSLYEPLGMAQIEALALGVPVVASRTGGIPETIEHAVTGLLAEPGNVDDWAAALHRAFSDLPAMLAFARAGRADVRARFSAQNNLEQIFRISKLSSQPGASGGPGSAQGVSV
jgi:glycosyltransferase involved in cell wall biosynthesis